MQSGRAKQRGLFVGKARQMSGRFLRRAAPIALPALVEFSVYAARRNHSQAEDPP
jgi:hypothetical protein